MLPSQYTVHAMYITPCCMYLGFYTESVSVNSGLSVILLPANQIKQNKLPVAHGMDSSLPVFRHHHALLSCD